MGTDIDPLGIFRTNPVVWTNDINKNTMETTWILIRLAKYQLNASDDGLEASNLYWKEVVDLATTLVDKVCGIVG